MTLAVFNPSVAKTTPPPTIFFAFQTIFLPHLIAQKRSADTIGGYRRFVRIWGEWESEMPEKYRTTSPVPCSAVTAEHLLAFRDWLISTRKMSPRNANKHVGGIQAILAHLQTWGKDEFVVSHAPKLPALPHAGIKAKLYFRFLLRQEDQRLRALLSDEVAGGPSSLSLSDRTELAELRRRDELSRLYGACSAAYWPLADRTGQAIVPRDHWQAAIVLLTLYGFRLGELIASKPKHRPLTWGQISWDAETPVAGYHATNAAGWLWYTPAKQAWSKPEPLVLPLHPVAAEHLRRIKPAIVAQSTPVFNWPTTKHSLYGVWSAILAQAGFVFKRNLQTGQVLRLKPENLRKTCDTWHNYHRPGVAPLITGHSSRSESIEARTLSSCRVVAEHYDNSEFAVVEAIQSLPIPEAWRAGLAGPTNSDQQRMLF